MNSRESLEKALALLDNALNNMAANPYSVNGRLPEVFNLAKEAREKAQAAYHLLVDEVAKRNRTHE